MADMDLDKRFDIHEIAKNKNAELDKYSCSIYWTFPYSIRSLDYCRYLQRIDGHSQLDSTCSIKWCCGSRNQEVFCGIKEIEIAIRVYYIKAKGCCSIGTTAFCFKKL